MIQLKVGTVGLLALLSIGQAANAAVSAEEAARLKTVLTPLGAEKAGNKDGSIPAWTGGVPKVASREEKLPVDPFPNEKPLFRITGQNLAQYADKLSEGTQALLKKYAGYYVDVYSTHRTAAAPQYVYDNTFKNATRAKLVEGSLSIEGAYGGVPFPIPKSGIEVYWNHTLRPKPLAVEISGKNWVNTANGQMVVANRSDMYGLNPFYLQDGSLEKWDGDYMLSRQQTTEPPYKVGESLVMRDNVNPEKGRAAWQYLVGQRRVRRAPTVGYDTPDFVSSGANYFDEVFGFWSAPDRYEWKLVGKKELYVPYNVNRFINQDEKEQFSQHHLNPEKLRWELHRVWVVEASLAPGKRHAVPKRRLYMDEDTWGVVLMDGYDAEGRIWRTSQVLPFALPEVPVVVTESTAVYNLQAGTFAATNWIDQYRTVTPKPSNFFTGDAIANSGGR